MTKQDTALYADIDKIDVPAGLRKLDRNHVETIAASIKAKKRLYVPILLKAAKGGRFVLVDGQHRLAAMTQNGETRIKYELAEDEDAGDVANMVRKQYSFAERIKVVTQRKADADSVLASALGVTERKVKQLRQLSALPQEVVDAVDAGVMSERVAQRATMLPPKMLGELAKALRGGKIPYWAESVEEISETIEDVRIPTRAALFDIEASGLKYERDLFDADGGYFHDAKAFMQHQVRATEEIARSLSANVAIASGGKSPSDWYSHTSFHYRAGHAAVRAALKPDVAARVKALDTAISGFEKKVAGGKSGLNLDVHEQLDASRDQLSRLLGRPDSYDPEKMKNVRVIAKIDRHGEAEFKIIPATVAAKAGKPGTAGSAGKAAAGPKKPLDPHTRKACAIARDHRDLLIQEAMLANETFALKVILTSLKTGGDFGVRIDGRAVTPLTEDHGKRLGPIAEQKSRGDDSFDGVWKQLGALKREELIAGIVKAITPFGAHGSDYPKMQNEDRERLHVLREAVVLTESPPLPYDYFAAHQNAQLLAILAKVKGKKEAALYEGKPKKTVAAAVQAACLEAGWLPDIVEYDPVAKPRKAKAPAKAPEKRKAA
ncbi:ParB/RepB/Spo0J family partition protein [Parvibaculum sp.]|uniref:ParB/RepB/Spo0J family partition protein n=1 Tax=Parvibaculum sp. TaxID=2024848 RepID=UPI001DD3D29D|nr:ParB/RepB/Spo0J family partition protein [Parvibaculum sp.]MBX3490853.1 ParB/RepB/Spo0J family partition protein [Parvibaculum sp.]